MGLFDKKNCDICGEKIGMLGNRKLDDGNLCKDCAKKLSPFFSERRHSTVADITAQLAYRENNKAAVAAFNVTRTLGVGTKVMLDEDAGKFMVTSAKKWQDENPDVLDYSQVTGCNLKVDEHKRELKQSINGKQVSYQPPRFEYNYDFNMIINVNSPWFDEIKFRLNNTTVKVHQSISGSGLIGAIGNVISANAGVSNPAMRQYEQMAEEIRIALTEVRQNVRENIATANAPKKAQTCPHCGATTTPDTSGCCEFCGGAIG
ncbi:MAG: DUF4428 domain-containing protein [Clostridiales bacterium]|nr:DUF4428 domain-containing protein [Clostridiales bacterium]